MFLLDPHYEPWETLVQVAELRVHIRWTPITSHREPCYKPQYVSAGLKVRFCWTPIMSHGKPWYELLDLRVQAKPRYNPLESQYELQEVLV